MAEDEINKLSPDQLLDRIKVLEEEGAQGLRNKAGQEIARNNWIKNI